MTNFIKFEAISFPWRIYDHSGNLLAQGDGSLFDEPFVSDRTLLYYSSIRKAGWTLCPEGYAVYAREIQIMRSSFVDNAILVIGSLKIHGFSSASGKSPAFNVKTSKERVQSHIDVVLSSSVDVDAHSDMVNRFDEITRQNVHELRGINGAILHAAEELEGLVKDQKKQKDICGNIIALTQILSSRMDLISYVSSSGMSHQSSGEVQVFQKFDKMCRSFKPQAARRRILIKLTGICRSSVYGANSIFELIPYLLLDNAIKYSPDGRTIEVSVNQVEDEIVCLIASYGPAIEKDETERIFDGGYRGKNAIVSSVSGTGIGLEVLKRMVENEYGGSVTVNCGIKRDIIKGIPYSDIKFKCIFPIYNY